MFHPWDDNYRKQLKPEQVLLPQRLDMPMELSLWLLQSFPNSWGQEMRNLEKETGHSQTEGHGEMSAACLC